MAGSRCHVSGREPVRPHDAGKERDDDGREMCEIDEEGEDSFGHKAKDQEEDAFNRWMRPFNPDVEEGDEGAEGAKNHEEAEEEGIRPKIKKVVTKPTPEEV